MDVAFDVLELTGNVVSAYISHNPIPPGELPSLIAAVGNVLMGLAASSPEPADALVPAVPVKKSITPDYIFSLEDGRPYKMLKSQLTRLGLTPDTYRAKWGLRSDYPMVAPNHSKVRSELAMRIGLGSKASARDSAAEPKRARGRPRKAS